jgi:SAM-dependent methyltransferase
MHAGAPRIDLSIVARAVDALELPQASLLEIGCGSGYYSEILSRLPKTRIDYTGVDYSPAMIERAKERYPGGTFRQMDATKLDFADASFDIAFNGVSLMHVPDWRRAVAEGRRVARRACIFHTVPMFAERDTAYIRKYAYGAPVEEMVFNRNELLRSFADAGLRVAQTWTSLPYDVYAVAGEPSFTETFLCLPNSTT